MSPPPASSASPRPAYDVTWVDARHHERLFVDLRRAALGVEASSEAVFRWQYQEGPEGPTEALLLHHLDHHRPEPVGWISVQPRRLAVDGDVHLAGLLVNLVVTPPHRTVQPALLLQRGAAEAARRTYDLSYGYPNHAALGGFLRARYRKLAPIVRYTCPLGDQQDALERAGASPALARLAGGAANLVGPAVRRALWWRWSRRYAFEWVSDADERFDALWQRALAEGRGRVVGERTAAFLRWRLLRHPGESHALGLLLERRSGSAAGYVAVRRTGNRALVGDLLATDRHYGPLLDGLLAELTRDGVDGVDIGYLGHPKVVAAMTWRGFRPRQELRTVIVDSGAIAQGWLHEPARWHLTSADGDL